MRATRRRWVPWVIVGLFAAARAVAAPPPVNVTLEPRQISLGETAQLTITSEGMGMDGITLPQVAGLEFRVVGQSRRVEIINGATLATTSVILRVTPETAGIFTIPGITPNSQPLVLRVNPDNGSGSASQYNNPNLANRPPLAAGGSSSNGIRMTADGAAFVRMNLPKRDVYVGESIPVDIEVGMRAGFVQSLNGLPTLTGNDFTLNNLSRKPERVEKLVDGKPFTVLTWHSVLAPVKPGTFTLSVQSPLTIRVRTRPARDSLIDDLLGDPFMQNFFGATVAKDVTVSSPPEDLKVLALPTEGRPNDFSGAVGSFKIASDLSATTAAVGDPLTLRLHVTGTGNFDRVDTPMLEHVEQWKTYPPKSSFKESDAIGVKGEKTFEQPLIAAHPGPQTLPDLTFSYFDPDTRRYETARTAPPPVTIAPALADAAPGAPSSTTAAAPATPGSPTTAGASRPAAAVSPEASSPGMRPDHAITADAATSLVPLYLRPTFLAVPLLALAFAGGWFGMRYRGPSRGTSRGRNRRSAASANRLLEPMRAAARAGDAAAFFTSACIALREALAVRWQIAPEQLTADDMAARLAADANPDAAGVLEIFALADEANYAGRDLKSIDYDRWTQVVRSQLLEAT
jgi:hypothetical protein